MPDVISPTVQTSTTAVVSPRETYDALAEVYDAYTAGDDYERWTVMLNKVIEEVAGKAAGGRTLLDVACGTGNSTFALSNRGYRTSGFDLSSAMIERARRKTTPEQADRLWVDDMTSFRVHHRFDVVTCLDDAVNHVLDPDELYRAFGRIAESLSPGGVFAFDTNTRRTYETYWSTDSVIDDSPDGVVFARRSLTPGPFEPEQISMFVLDSFVPAPAQRGWRRVSSTHAERHYGTDWITSALSDNGLRPTRVMGLHDSGVFDPHLDETFHTKAVHFAVKD